jgi:hypothetical protein
LEPSIRRFGDQWYGQSLPVPPGHTTLDRLHRVKINNFPKGTRVHNTTIANKEPEQKEPPADLRSFLPEERGNRCISIPYLSSSIDSLISSQLVAL